MREWSTAARCATCGGYHEPVVTPPAPRVLSREVLESLPSFLGRTEAPRLLAELAETRITRAVAEVGDELVESVLIRFRHAGARGFAAWHNGAGQGVTLVLPQLRRLSVEVFRIEFGLLKLRYVMCDLPNCYQEIRAKADGWPRVHKNRAGQPCTVARVMINSPWFVGPLREGDSR